MRAVLIVLALGALMACRKNPSASSSIEECKYFIFDLTDGTMNGVKPTLPQGEIREWIPCVSRFIPNGAESDCRGALVYNPYHFTFYTYLDDYIEVKSGFKGKGDTLFKQNRAQLRILLGSPVQNTNSLQYPDNDFFTTDYGCIRVQYKNDLPVLIAPHYSDCESLRWCLDSIH